ncbi:DUF4129 domain-containing protein [Occultella glacieicola]|uniref:DUF4129 domain-containing protein n=1 Tax=Occultella glacieicola TaxID=2518684 RepID=A0ABY2ECD5_9MICO|nr:DUF4129 domain-containing protein [Occultella glacieicola]TDE97494.1 DUF4129 domain-containing protein [Occultella glacieicola]
MTAARGRGAGDDAGPGHARPADPRRPIVAAGRTAVVAAICLFAVLAATAVGPWEITERWQVGDLGTGEAPTVPASEQPTPDETPTLPEFLEDLPVPDLSWLGLVAGLVVAVIIIALLMRYLAYLRRPLEDEPDAQGRLVGGDVADVDPDLPVLEQGVSAALAHLDQIREPRDAIVAAWLALEDAAAGSGVVRQPAQTPTEFTAGVLDRTEADPRATATLLGLYHRARFSSATVTAEDVATAATCLADLARSWTALRAAVATEVRPGPGPDREEGSR